MSVQDDVAALSARVADLENKLADRPAPGIQRCLRCGADANPIKMRASDPSRHVYHCDRCAWDFEV